MLVGVVLTGRDLDPTLVTSLLGMSPTRAHRRGEKMPRRTDREYPSGVWSLESGLSSTESLEAQLTALLDRLEPRAEAIARLVASGVDGAFFCSYFIERATGRVALSGPILMRMSAFGLDFVVDVYCEEPSDGES